MELTKTCLRTGDSFRDGENNSVANQDYMKWMPDFDHCCLHSLFAFPDTSHLSSCFNLPFSAGTVCQDEGWISKNLTGLGKNCLMCFNGMMKLENFSLVYPLKISYGHFILQLLWIIYTFKWRNVFHWYKFSCQKPLQYFFSSKHSYSG